VLSNITNGRLATVVSKAEYTTSFCPEDLHPMFRRNFLLAVALLAGAFFGLPGQAKATYQVTLTSGSSTAVVNDNNSPAGTFSDTNVLTNFIDFGGGGTVTFAGYSISFTGNTNTPGVGGVALQTSQTITITNTGGAANPLTIDVFADGYLPGLSNPSKLAVSNSISTSLITNGATGSATTLINGGGAGLTTTTVSVTGPTISGSAQSPTLITIPTATPFSMTSRLVISGLTTAGAQANLTWTSAATTAVPEPGSLILLACGLPVLLAARRRRSKKSAEAEQLSPQV